MDMHSQLIHTIIPLTVCVLGILPFLFNSRLRQNDEDIAKFTFHFMFCYLLLLGFAVIALIMVQATLVMSSHIGSPSLFICTILLVACIDKLIDLSQKMVFIKANLLKRLLYFVFLLSSIPILWQLLTKIVPESLSQNTKLMTGVEVLLILSMFALGVVNRPAKKKAM